MDSGEGVMREEARGFLGLDTVRVEVFLEVLPLEVVVEVAPEEARDVASVEGSTVESNEEGWGASSLLGSTATWSACVVV